MTEKLKNLILHSYILFVDDLTVDKSAVGKIQSEFKTRRYTFREIRESVPLQTYYFQYYLKFILSVEFGEIRLTNFNYHRKIHGRV